jgi:2-oxoglutarate dehydrogenase E1 component
MPALNGANRAWIEALYAQYLESASSVDPTWRAFFDRWRDDNGVDPSQVVTPPPVRRSIFGGRAAGAMAGRAEHTHKNAAVLQLISTYRRNGHLVANLDPLGLRERRELPQLTLGYHGLSESDLDSTFHTGRLAGPKHATLREILARCEATYCSTLGSEFMYIRDERRRRWLEHRIEESGGRTALDRPTALRVLDKLASAEKFESFIHTKFLGAKRFSVEGGESVIPFLDVLIDTAGKLGVTAATIGMAHRGRLNVLANILGKAHGDIFEEFEDKGDRPDHLGSGDVKYHMGYSADVETASGNDIHLNLAFNPSHLEFVAPVVDGAVRARQDHFGDTERKEALSIIIHGDAAIAGQGIATETINLGRLEGYDNGGSVHIVINNQIGFTTPPESSRSSEHCTDIVKVILLPVLHVNGDDLGAVAFAARLAAEYRQEFGQDIVIDIWCYRKYGHNEADEPAFTNPLMYQSVRARKTPLEVFSEEAVRLGTLTEDDVTSATRRIREHLDAELTRARESQLARGQLAGLWKGLHVGFSAAAVAYPTKIAAEVVNAILQQTSATPTEVNVHRKVQRVLNNRRAMAEGKRPLDWAAGEALAFGSLVLERHPVRLTGQDSGRGTFSHRHAVLHDQETGDEFVPLNNLDPDQATFEVINSPLSEAGCLGFEYGYTLIRPDALVAWEAQFGDFANGAQVLIDQFISSSEAKWNRCSGLVMLLPHGYEGQGPEHSSARLERFLTLSGDENWRIMNLTTPAQYFHAMRGQLCCNFRKPMVVMTPKSLLRHPRAVSSLNEFSEGWFQPVIGDPTVETENVERVVLCSGKVYYDLLAHREEHKTDNVAIVRVEQLYPFREDLITEAIAPFKAAKEVIWCQEEPLNMGAWSFLFPLLHELLELPVRYVGRARSSSPATGSKHLHESEQADLVARALTV